MAFIRYIEVDFKFGLLDCVYITGISLYRDSLYRGSVPYNVHFTVTLARPKNMELAKYKLIYKFRSQMQPHVCKSVHQHFNLICLHNE